MSKGTIVTLSVVGAIVLLTIIVVSWGFGIVNGEVRLANRYEAQFNVRETTLDTMRKTLMNQFKVTKEFADKFIASATAVSEGRKGVLASWT